MAIPIRIIAEQIRDSEAPSEDDRGTSHAAHELNQEKSRGQNSQKSSVEFRPSTGQVMPSDRKEYLRMNLVTS